MAFIEEMEGQKYIDKTRQYLDYLQEHLNNVKYAFNELSKICKGMWWVNDDYLWHTLREEVIHHDLSKFCDKEFTEYREAFFPVGEKIPLQTAWEHHKQCNSHHHETVKTDLDVIHMIIDWMAMGYKFGSTPQEYYEKNKNKIKLSDRHKQIMFDIFNKIKERQNE